MSSFKVLNFTIPNDLKSLYEDISSEFEKVVWDAVKTQDLVLEQKSINIHSEKGTYETF